MQIAVEYFLAQADSLGPSVNVYSASRTFSEQTALFAKGRTIQEIAQKVKKHGQGGAVTDAAAGESPHNYGLAIDIESDQLDEVMRLARHIGFGTVSWDPDHIEWPNWRSLIR
jgi:LAS superfamily LD-carboxypeptidase LdcB